jgi:hypothetical protein
LYLPTVRDRLLAVLQALSIVFALAAVAFMVLAIAGSVRGDTEARTGFLLRAAAVACFAIAVVLDVAR